MATDFGDLETADAVRLTWNVWPASRVEATKCTLPFAALYSPCRALPSMPVLPYDPIACKNCGAVLNPYARVDFHGKIWICPFCYTRSHFPPHYAAISEQNLPAELFPSYCTIEYTLTQQNTAMATSSGPAPPCYVFIIDTCVSEEELNALKTSMLQAIETMPETTLVGLVTYGTNVHVHELGFESCFKSYVFRGSKETFDVKEVQEQLGVLGAAPAAAPAAPAAPGQRAPPPASKTPGALGRFICPLGDCEFQLSAILEELQPDSFPIPAEHRAARCTGSALTVTGALMAAARPGGQHARAVLFVGGACADGPGAIISRELENAVRSHKDIVKGSATHFAKSRAYFSQLATEWSQRGHTLDVFSVALDQVGLSEMKPLCECTGGMSVLAESYTHDVFKKSLKLLLSPRAAPPPPADGSAPAAPQDASYTAPLGQRTNASLEVLVSRDVKVSGCLGPVDSLGKKGPMVSDTVVGHGGTTHWRMSSVAEDTTLALFFDIAAESGQARQGDPTGAYGQGGSEQFFLQFITRSVTSTGEHRMRATTITRRWVDGTDLRDMTSGFDQEAAAVVMARLAAAKMEAEEAEFDATRWLDRSLIRMCSRFGDYRREDPASFQLAPQISLYPQFIFNLRRSQFVQVFNFSPDETAHFRMCLNRVPCSDALAMIQPTLMSYGFQGPPEPALLDVASIAPDRILLLDTFFHTVVFHGQTVAQWREAKYQEQPEHAAFKALLEAPQSDAASIVDTRFPSPRFVDCDQNGSQARFLLARLNPSATYNRDSGVGTGGDIIFTDDVALGVFLDHLKKLAVAG
ncbi:protein transport protein Sec23 [Pycnococcus provasolii]